MRRWFYAPAAAAVVAGMLPLLAAFPAPLQDWPNHLAGAAVADALLRGDPFWLRFYSLGTFLVPDAALGLGLLGLQRLGLGVPAAGAVFLCVTYAVFVGGVLALARALRAEGPEKPLLAVLLFYSAALFWGLAGYVLGVGLLLLLLALALSVRSAGARVAVGVAGAAALALVHPVPAVAFVVLLGCVVLPRLRGDRRQALAVLAAAATLAGMLRLLAGHATDHRLRYAGGTAAGFVPWKLRVFATALLGGPLWQDALSVLAALCCIGAPLALARSRLTRDAWLALAGTAALTLGAPERLGGGSLLDVRLAILPLLVLACGTQVQWRSARARRLGLAAMAAAVLARTAAIGLAWRQAGAVFAAFRAASAAVPAGSLMMMGHGTPLPALTWRQVWTPPIQSLAAGVAVRGVFFPALFANPAQQPIVLRATWRDWAQPWDLADDAHREAAARRIAALCDGRFAGVFLTVLYSGGVAAAAGPAVLAATPHFVLLDACRLRS